MEQQQLFTLTKKLKEVRMMEYKLCNYHKYVLHKRAVNLFTIQKFIPEISNLHDNRLEHHRMLGLFKAFMKIGKLTYLPVIHAKSADNKQTILEEKQSQNKAGLDHADKLKTNSTEQEAEPISPYAATDKEVETFLAYDTPEERIKRFWKYDQEKQRSPEMKFILDNTIRSAAVTYFTFFCLSYTQEKMQFIRENKAAVNFSPYMAQRKLRDNVIRKAMLYGFKWGFKVFFLVGTASVTAQSISSYRNKSSCLEYMVGAGVACSLTRIMHGPEGMLVGFIIGTVIGLCIGVPSVAMQKMNNMTQQERNIEHIKKYIEFDKRNRGQRIKPLETIPDLPTDTVASKQQTDSSKQVTDSQKKLETSS